MSFYDDDDEDDAYEFDYSRVLSDTDELYNNEDDYHNEEYCDEPEYEHYYHNVMDELDNE